MSSKVTVVAHPNIALSKYWGKAPREGNFPAVPSLSVTLSGMTTTTTVVFLEGQEGDDELTLGGSPMAWPGRYKAQSLLDSVRQAAGVRARAVVTSTNDFPTGSGLASSASGFAALALAAVRAAGLDWNLGEISALARRASASAARSLFGGFVELPLGSERAVSVAPCEALDLSVLVCVTTDLPKAVGSSEGMTRTAQESPFYEAWLEKAPRIHAQLRGALEARDLGLVGALAERSALAMHASALAAGVVYLKGVSLELLQQVQSLRREGLLAFATMDAGPHVKVLVSRESAPLVRARLASVPGVLRVLETRPGEGARVLEEPRS